MSAVFDSEKGKITVTAATLSALIARSAERVPGVRVRRGRRRLDVQIADGRIHVSIELLARYGLVLPEVARAVQHHVRDVLETMCGLDVEAVDVAVEVE